MKKSMWSEPVTQYFFIYVLKNLEKMSKMILHLECIYIFYSARYKLYL